MSHHRPRKRFGQNFLHDPIIINRIINAFAPDKNDFVVEIGPGQGALTRPLLEKLPHLHVIELDRDLVTELQQKFDERLSIYSADVLKFDFSTLTNQNNTLRIIGNLPYNISTPLLFHLIRHQHLIHDMIFMLQKEVVERIAASPGNSSYGRLSVMLQYYYKTEPLFVVHPGAFTPPPAVDSAIIRLTPRTPDPRVKDEDLLSRIVTAAFSQRRKTLRNTLKSLASTTQLEDCGIDPVRRAETVSLEEFVCLSNSLASESET